jgi:hypothetical protein
VAGESLLLDDTVNFASPLLQEAVGSGSDDAQHGLGAEAQAHNDQPPPKKAVVCAVM